MLKGYRTVLSNGLIMTLSSIEVFTGVEIAVDDKTAFIAGALALMNIVYRFITTTKVGSKS
jgi:rRNA processing protein Krr1/Pno1